MGQTNSNHETVTQPSMKHDVRNHGNDMTRCAICLNISTSRTPRTLSCRHTFCHKCIKGVYNAAVGKDYMTKGTICCPVCSVVTQITDIIAAGPRPDVAPPDEKTDAMKSPESSPDVTMVTASVVPATSLGDISACVASSSLSTSQSTDEATSQPPPIISTPQPISAPIPLPASESTPHLVSATMSHPASESTSHPVVMATLRLVNGGSSHPDEESTSNSQPPTTDVTDKRQAPSLKRRYSETNDDGSSVDEDYHDSSQVVDEPPVAKKEDAHLCSLCMNSKPKRKKTEVAFYCFDCTSSLCEGCKEKHDLRPRCRGHVCCAVTKDTIKSLICEEHQEFADDYCLDCKSVTCAECHVTKHRGHNIRDFTTEPVQSPMMRELDQRRARIMRTLAGVDNTEGQYIEEIKNTREEMTKWRNNIIGNVNSTFEAMFTTLEDENTTWRAKTQKVRSNVEAENDFLNELTSRCVRLMSPLEDIQGLHVCNAQELLTGLRQQIPRTDHMYTRPDTYLFVPEEGLKRCCGQLIKVPASELKKH